MKFYKTAIFLFVVIVYSVGMCVTIKKQKENQIVSGYYSWYNSPTTPHKYKVTLKYDYKSEYSYRTIYDAYYTKEFRYSMTKDEAIKEAKDWLLTTEHSSAKNIRVVSCENMDNAYER